MGDSDDEYDRKRRDKFRGERAEANYRGAERTVRPRDDWSDREAWSRPRPREYRGAMRDRGYSPSIEPQTKRMRHDYYPPENYYNHYQPYHQASHREPPPTANPEGTQPPMMSFKAFLAAQDDNISDSEAVEKYNDYKLEFQRQQLNEFFVAHKDDEWFRLKYHPEDSVKRKDDQMKALKRRVEVFLELLNGDKFQNISVDCSRQEEMIKMLDTVVIKLEGGTDADLAVLDQEETEPVEDKKVELKTKSSENGPAKEPEQSSEASKLEATENKSDDSGEILEPGEAKEEEKEKEVEVEKKEDKSPKSDEEKEAGEADTDEILKDEPAIEKKDKSVEPEDEKETAASEDKEELPKEAEDKNKDEEVGEKIDSSVDKIEDEKTDETGAEEDEGEVKEVPTSAEKKRKRSFSGSSSSSSSSSESEGEADNREKVEEEKPAPEKEEVKVEKLESIEEEETTVVVERKNDNHPRALHKTTSIFLRNLAPTITKQEVEAMCSRYAGFLRVALAEPQPDRRWLRRGWVTFTRDANIKEICWNLNNIRLRDCELGAIVNRDLSRRIRQVNGITAHKQVVRSDIRISAKVALHLDTKSSLWTEEKESSQPQQSFGLVSNNPVLHNITDYLIEEASAEEEELLGLESSTDNQDNTNVIVERDDVLISVLDKIILYLRIVHSVDYYNHCEYPHEDEMPNRCGILHARGPPPMTQTDISAFIGNAVESKMSHFLPEKVNREEGKNETKLITLALKDVDMEIDKFVQANTRELAKDKWLCPLSGKKFKGPDFVRKHIFNKHAEKIEEVKKEVEFFNNYLKDPKRPMLEAAPVKREEPPAYSHPPYGSSYGGYNGPPRYNQGYYNQRSRGYPRPRGGGSTDFRPVIHYRDLDAPREPEEFI